jgi:hypothetical protein
MQFLLEYIYKANIVPVSALKAVSSWSVVTGLTVNTYRDLKFNLTIVLNGKRRILLNMIVSDV